MKTIIQRIESGDLTRDMDISDEVGGFWRLAGERATKFVDKVGENENHSRYLKNIEDIQTQLCKDYWELYEEATGYVDPRDIPF